MMELEQKIENIFTKFFGRLVRDSSELVTSSTEIASSVAVYMIEEFRTSLMHPINQNLRKTLEENNLQVPKPRINHYNTDPALYSILEHSGDFLEGYSITLWAYFGLRVLFPNIKDQYLLAASSAIAGAVVLTHESGIFGNQKPDLWDVPAGVAGSLAYICFHYFAAEKLGRKFGNKLNGGL